MKKIVIFGATGNLGAYLTDYCVSNLPVNEFEVVAVGRKKTSFFTDLGISYVEVDTRNEHDFLKLPTDDIYAVINLTGVLPAYLPVFDPFVYVDSNITGSLRIMEYARKNHADRVLYTQTWADQGGYWGKEEVLSPDMPRKLVYSGDHAFYAITKTMVVETMEYYKQEYGIRNFVFRLPNVYLYHPEQYYYVDGQKKPIGYRYMINLACEGKPIEIWGDPDAFKDILYVKDLCQMMYRALFAPIDGGTYNAGTGIKTTLREQIEGIVQVFSPSDHPSKIIERPEKPNFVSFVMDIEKAVLELGYHSKYTYTQYLQDYKEEMEAKRFLPLWKKA